MGTRGREPRGLPPHVAAQDGFSDLGPLESIDVSIDDGSLVDGVIGPIVNQLRQVTSPLQPVVSLLEAPLPVLSNLNDKAASLNNGNAPLASPVTLTSLLPQNSGLSDFINAVNTINGPDLNEPLVVPADIQFGSFDVWDPRMTAPGCFRP